MRKNQIDLTITRFGDQVPKGYPEDRMVVNIYSDSNNLYAALSEAYAKAINVMEEYERVGVRCDITTNSDETISSKLLNLRYDENYQQEYINGILEMYKQLIGYIENSNAILDIIKTSSKENVRRKLQEKLGYSQKEIKNIMRINFGMMTAEDIDDIKSEIAKLEKTVKERNLDGL